MESTDMNHRNEYALITGATSGIGYELARLFAADSINLILVARSAERLEEVCDELKEQFSIECTPIAKNLFEKNAAYEIYEAVKDMGVTVSYLVNDAGQGEWGYFLETDLDRDLDIVQLNISSLVSLTKYFGREMAARNEGHILQLGSEAGKTPAPLLSVYSATKAFVISFSVALASELKCKGVTVTVLLPGATDTDFFHKAKQNKTKAYLESELDTPQRVALDGYRALMKGESKIISGVKTKMHVLMTDILGDTVSASYMHKQMEPSEKNKTTHKRPAHAASLKERENIESLTGKPEGDIRHN